MIVLMFEEKHSDSHVRNNVQAGTNRWGELLGFYSSPRILLGQSEVD